MHAIEAIDLLELVTVTGGDGAAPATNTERTTANGNVGVTVRGTQVGVQGGYSHETVKTDPAQCAQDVRRTGGTTADILACYGRR